MGLTVFANNAAQGIPTGIGGEGSGELMNILGQVLPFVLLIAVFYFIILRPQKKREKETEKMRDAVKVGDTVVTIGGVLGKVVKVKDENITIESGTGAEKSKSVFKKWAIQTVEKSSNAKQIEEEPETED